MRLGDRAIVRKHLEGRLAQVPQAAAPGAQAIREGDPGRLLAGAAEAGALDAGAPLARMA
jgi:hypothetical protein